MSIEDFEKQLSQFGEAVANMDLHLLEVGSKIVNEMKLKTNEVFSDQATGKLRDSIKAQAQSNVLSFIMLYYGPFQNYGVVGAARDRGVKQVPFGVNPVPREGGRYSFRKTNTPVGGDLPLQARYKIRYFGLKPKTFFDINALKQRIAAEVNARMIEIANF